MVRVYIFSSKTLYVQLKQLVSSLIAQGTEFPLRKPAGFHWDIFLVGITTGIAGLLGIPFPNGLIPQAPFHTKSLCVTKNTVDSKNDVEPKISHVVEQRISNLAQGMLTLATMSHPFLIILHLVPQGVLAGLFFIMGIQALQENSITLKILFLLKDRNLTSQSEPLLNIRRKKIWYFLGIQLFAFGATFAITQTIAAVGFPVIILLLIPFRRLVLPAWFTSEEIKLLDGPIASPLTMISVGGNSDDSVIDTNHLVEISNPRSDEGNLKANSLNPENPGVIMKRCEFRSESETFKTQI